MGLTKDTTAKIVEFLVDKQEGSLLDPEEGMGILVLDALGKVNP